MKKIILVLAVIIAVGSLSFFGGFEYGKGKAVFSPETMRQRFQAGADNVQFFQRGSENMLTGEILSQDEGSLTLKMRDGGSKIVFFPADIPVNRVETKTTTSSAAELLAGQTIIVTGTANEDGSFKAENIQLREDFLAK